MTVPELLHHRDDEAHPRATAHLLTVIGFFFWRGQLNESMVSLIADPNYNALDP